MSMGVVLFLTLPILASAWGASFLGAPAGLVALVLTALFVVWWLRRSQWSDDFVFTVAGDTLDVHRGTRFIAKLRLRDLADVVLDTKSIRKVEEGTSMLGMLRGLDLRVGAELDVSRIVLVAGDGTETPLSVVYLSNSEATEWLGKIRVFLRKLDWLPEDERGA